MVEILEIGVLIALGAWVLTQIHLILAVKGIKKDIDAKRSETQTFVDERMSKLEATVGGFEGRMTAQMPPNLHGEVTELKAEIATKLDAMDRGLVAALQDVERAFNQVKGGWGDAENELRKAMKDVDEEGRSALEEAVAQADTSNPVVRRLYAWAAKPIDPKLEAKNPIGAAALQIGKAALLDRLQANVAGEPLVALGRRSGSFRPGLPGR